MKGGKIMDIHSHPDIDDVMLSTYDNPLNPYDDFVGWWKYDMMLGHDCCGTLARESTVNDIASDVVNDEEILQAMLRIVSREPTIYKLVFPSDFEVA